jgi:hypothetical protein
VLAKWAVFSFPSTTTQQAGQDGAPLLGNFETHAICTLMTRTRRLLQSAEAVSINDLAQPAPSQDFISVASLHCPYARRRSNRRLPFQPSLIPSFPRSLFVLPTLQSPTNLRASSTVLGSGNRVHLKILSMNHFPMYWIKKSGCWIMPAIAPR